MRSEQTHHTELNWKDLLANERQSDYFKQILKYVESERSAGKVIYPSNADMFKAFKLTEFDKLKVVILGQDPYHGAGQAHGLCFSVPKGINKPPSLQNIFKELNNDLKIPIPESGDLVPWAQQGVLLLNSCLSVEASKPGSHSEIGWQKFTDFVIKTINQHKNNVVFLLWGSYAQQKASLIDQKKNHILMTTHPSPFSAYRGFMGSKHFSKCNQILEANKVDPIDWKL